MSYVYDIDGSIIPITDYVTPEEFGAVGGGVVDDSTAFALALQDGRPIKLSNRTYKANISIDKSDVTIFGCGENSIIIPADSTIPVIKINKDSAETTTDIIDRIYLQNFQIIGEADTVGVSMRCCQYCILEKLIIDRCYTEAIRLRGVFDSRIRDCSITICGNNGFLGEDDGKGNYAITIDQTVEMNTNAIVFSGIRIEKTPRMIKLQNTQQLMFTDCKFETHAIPYPNDATLAPIKAIGICKGIIFVNCVCTYSGSLFDTETELIGNGIPLIYTQLNDIATSDESYVLFSACQFRCQKKCLYFSGNYLHFIGCTFNRIYGSGNGNTLEKHSSLIDSNMAIADGGRVLNIEGEQVIVDNVRINVDNDDPNTSVIHISNSAVLGKVAVIYNGTDRSNLADGTIKIPVEFIGLRSYVPS